MVELQLPKLVARVRFPSLALCGIWRFSGVSRHLRSFSPLEATSAHRSSAACSRRRPGDDRASERSRSSLVGSPSADASQEEACGALGGATPVRMASLHRDRLRTTCVRQPIPDAWWR